MRLRTCNSRRKRLYCGKKVPTGNPFCYVVYGKKVVKPIFNGWGSVINYEVRWREWKRPFTSYSEAIAHLTRVKLAIDEEDREWKFTTPCKIVEGVYTRSGKEYILKTVRLNDECDRPPERHFGSGLPRQRIGPNLSIPKIVGNPYRRPASGGGQYTNPYVESSSVRSSGTASSSSSTTTVDTDGMQF